MKGSYIQPTLCVKSVYLVAQVQMTKIVAERDQAEPDQMTIPLTYRLPLLLFKTNPNNGLIDRHSRAPFCVHQK